MELRLQFEQGIAKYMVRYMICTPMARCAVIFLPFFPQRYTYDPLRYLSMPKTSLLVDPLDRRNTYVAPTTLDIPGVGEGLFARRDLRRGNLIAGYGGTLVSNLEDQNGEFCNLTQSVTEGHTKNTIRFSKFLRIDVPYGHEDLTVYRATLGHKANHQFDSRNNAGFELYRNPRFGDIRCLRAERDIRRGEEIFAHYGYHEDSLFAPSWYVRQLREEEREMMRAGQPVTRCGRRNY